MNVRITPRRAPQRTDLFGGVERLYSDGDRLFIQGRGSLRAAVAADDADYGYSVPLRSIAEIALDEDGAVP